MAALPSQHIQGSGLEGSQGDERVRPGAHSDLPQGPWPPTPEASHQPARVRGAPRLSRSPPHTRKRHRATRSPRQSGGLGKQVGEPLNKGTRWAGGLRVFPGSGAPASPASPRPTARLSWTRALDSRNTDHPQHTHTDLTFLTPVCPTRPQPVPPRARGCGSPHCPPGRPLTGNRAEGVRCRVRENWIRS